MEKLKLNSVLLGVEITIQVVICMLIFVAYLTIFFGQTNQVSSFSNMSSYMFVLVGALPYYILSIGMRSLLHTISYYKMLDNKAYIFIIEASFFSLALILSILYTYFANSWQPNFNFFSSQYSNQLYRTFSNILPIYISVRLAAIILLDLLYSIIKNYDY
jgi:hypothetical protein